MYENQIALKEVSGRAWMNHARLIGKQGWIVTYSIFYNLTSSLNHVGQALGVMDDFGNWVEVSE